MGEGPLYFGVELETEVSYGVDYAGVARKVIELAGDFCILKSDGSLQNGIEIVSCPCSFEVHKTIWERLFRQRPTGLTSWVSGRAGIHIHISKAALSKLQLGRMLVFVNAPANDNLITTVAGRAHCDFAKRYPKKVSSYKQSLGKFEALNTIHKHTVELRIFRGTLNYDSFLKNIEFAHALVMACGRVGGVRVMTPSECEQSAKFLAFVYGNKRTYPHLYEFLCRKRLLPAHKSAPGSPVVPEVIEI